MSTAHVDNHGELTRKASSVVAILERCLHGEDPATFSNGTVPALTIAAAHGYPSTKAMHANLLALRPLRDLPVTFITTTATEGPAMTTATGTIEQLLEDADHHDKASIRNAAQRIRERLDKLTDLIEADSEDAKRRARIAKLEAELAQLKGRKPKKATGDVGDHACPVNGCDRTFATTQAVAMHRRRAHEGFNPGTARPAGEAA